MADDRDVLSRKGKRANSAWPRAGRCKYRPRSRSQTSRHGTLLAVTGTPRHGCIIHLEGRPASLEDRGRSQGPAAYPAAMRGARAIRDLGRGRFQGGHRVHAKNVFPPALTAPRRVMESGIIRKHLRHSTYNTILLIVVVIAQHVNYLEKEYGICSTKTV